MNCYEGCHREEVAHVLIPDLSYCFELLSRAAALGHAKSQYRLGLAYEHGFLNLQLDPRRSIAWYTKSATLGDPDAELALAGWYLTGSEGVLMQSDSDAYLWARKSADKGLARAEYAVGYFTENGIGVRPDVHEARKWYLRAAAQNNKRSIQRLNELKLIIESMEQTSVLAGKESTQKEKRSCIVM
jgi:TPR repeat protein